MFQLRADDILHNGCKAINELGPITHQPWLYKVKDINQGEQTVSDMIPRKGTALMWGCCTRVWDCVWAIYQRRKCNVAPPPTPCFWPTRLVRNSCVMQGAAAILCVYRLKHAEAAQTGVLNTQLTHTHHLLMSHIPVQGRAHSSFSSRPSSKSLKAPEHIFGYEIHLHFQPYSET